MAGRDGKPSHGARVSVQIHQFMAGGFTPDQNTDTEGIASFALDIDSGAEITVYVNGQPKTHRGSPHGQYQIYL